MESNKKVIYIGLGIMAAVLFVFWLLPAAVLRPILYLILALGSIFLILLVLIQRGRGGGLAGAFGGMGGYSAFGTRAGDIFTRITIVAAAIWFLSAMALVRMNAVGSRLYDNPAAAAKPKTITPSTGLGPAEPLSTDEPDTTNDAPPPPPDSKPADSPAPPPGESGDQ